MSRVRTAGDETITIAVRDMFWSSLLIWTVPSQSAIRGCGASGTILIADSIARMLLRFDDAWPRMGGILRQAVLHLQPRQSFRIVGVGLRREGLGLVEDAYGVVDLARKTVVFVGDGGAAAVAEVAPNARRGAIDRGPAGEEFNVLDRIPDPDNERRADGLAAVVVVVVGDPEGPAAEAKAIVPAEAGTFVNGAFW